MSTKMTSGLTTKLRLVRCPKCRQLLPELPDHPVYKCGGCGTILQAKNQPNDVKITKSGLNETDNPQTNALDLVTEDKESGSSMHTDTVPSTGECSLDQNNVGDPRQSGYCRSEHLEGINLLNEGQNKEWDRCQLRDCNGEQLGGIIHLSNNDQGNEDDATESCDSTIKQPEDSIEECLATDLAPPENAESLPIVGSNLEVKANDGGLLLAGANSEVDINEGDSNIKISNTNNKVATMGSTSIVTHHMAARESISSDTPTSSPNEQLEQPQKNVHVFDRVRSTDTLETREFANPSSELSGGLLDISKSPTTISYYAYEGSVSSYDGTDDQFPERPRHLSRSTCKVANFVRSEERNRKDKFLVDSLMNCHPYLKEDGILSSTKKHSANRCGKWDQDELLEPKLHGHPVRNWRRRDRENYPSRVPFYGRGSLAGYEIGGPSNQVHNQFHRNSSFQSSDKSDYLEQDKLKLLRIVSELQDELNRRCYLNGKADGRVNTWKENHISTYNDHEAPVGELYNELNYPRFPRRGKSGGNWLEQRNFSCVRFSGEATSSRHGVHHSCLHCHPQDWQCSVQLPPQSILGNNQDLCGLHPGHKCYNPSYRSCPSSPHGYADSEFPMCSRDVKSEEQRHRDREVKKRHSAKQHFRPIAGGAPIISCYNCLSPLQIPADFLLFRKRFHWLRCGACSELLKFSLQNRTHLVPHALNAFCVPPPSEVGDYSDDGNRRLVSASHANASPYADPVSCSDDYGLSYCKSGSTEGDPVPFTSSHAIPGIADQRNMLSDPSKPVHERKESIGKRPQNKYKNSVETFDPAGLSSNMSKAEKLSSEIKPMSSSPLHRLMGYSSPSEVITGSRPSGME
ncbi:hypothetical protein I3760_01G305300 [Carya illinoinensis]|nr:hypothetical protein I3760_01G305300 [Carya illinoinensis]KAG2730673.1 hypothetical protein I3760_01G305300 [Carya illinoinensis]KAG2730674.1 hypothetical protein I3760_01G305300 [Carya illinoinensis]